MPPNLDARWFPGLVIGSLGLGLLLFVQGIVQGVGLAVIMTAVALTIGIFRTYGRDFRPKGTEEERPPSLGSSPPPPLQDRDAGRARSAELRRIVDELRSKPGEGGSARTALDAADRALADVSNGSWRAAVDHADEIVGQIVLTQVATRIAELPPLVKQLQKQGYDAQPLMEGVREARACLQRKDYVGALANTDRMSETLQRELGKGP